MASVVEATPTDVTVPTPPPPEATVTFETPVILPVASTVSAAICVELPYEPAVAPEAGKAVDEIDDTCADVSPAPTCAADNPVI